MNFFLIQFLKDLVRQPGSEKKVLYYKPLWYYALGIYLPVLNIYNLCLFFFVFFAGWVISYGGSCVDMQVI